MTKVDEARAKRENKARRKEESKRREEERMTERHKKRVWEQLDFLIKWGLKRKPKNMKFYGPPSDNSIILGVVRDIYVDYSLGYANGMTIFQTNLEAYKMDHLIDTTKNNVILQFVDYKTEKIWPGVKLHTATVLLTVRPVPTGVTTALSLQDNGLPNELIAKILQ